MKNYILSFLISSILFACSNSVNSPEMLDKYPTIYPDYVGTTVPSTIAPLNFCLKGVNYDCIDVIIKGKADKEIHINGSDISIVQDDWHNMLESSKGDSITITVCIQNDNKWKQYKSFPIYISKNPIDQYLAYRLIAPGYEVYSKMGIYQRDITNFNQKAILENTLVTNMCINCHSFNQTNPKETSIHVRGLNGATIMMKDGKNEYLNTKTDSTISACVYPYWHPTGNYIAYSVNKTLQGFHSVKDERIEVFDLASDIVVYHPSTHQIISSPLINREDAFETFPVFSPDGKTLYFCSAANKDIQSQYKEIRYDLCKISFNPQDGTFGERVDTLINVSSKKKSISFPRPSYDGKYIMFTLSDYGNFSIWHKEADLWIYDINSKRAYPLSKVNSNDTESFHNWSSNSKWFVFSSRRDDGLFTRLYIAGINEKGEVTKPFMLPQKVPYKYYKELEYSYNVPDFVNSPINIDSREVGRKLVSKKRVNVKLRSTNK